MIMTRDAPIRGLPVWLAFACLLASCQPDGQTPGRKPPASVSANHQQPPLPPQATIATTPHYRIFSSAAPGQTEQTANAVEHLFRAYTSFFGLSGHTRSDDEKLELVLYRDQAEFKQHNRSSPWAEAYYLPPRCHAYYAEGKANPYHWILHEATHQLTGQLAHFPKERWSDEGLAAYFGASQIRSGRIVPGNIDQDAYPVWWLGDLGLSGDRQADIERGRFIPLRVIVSGKGGPDFNQQFNLYYVEYWSLSHFLFHYHDGKYASQYKLLLSEGANLKNFERLIGLADAIEPEWYDYLRELVTTSGGRARITPAPPALP